MNKGDLTNNNDNEAHARKCKSLVEFNAKNTSRIFQKIPNLLFTVKISLFALEDVRWDCGLSSCTTKVKSEPFNLTFALLSPTDISFTSCNVLNNVFS